MPIWPLDGRGDPAPVDQKTLIQQCDPFHCECRAYGRLKETGREDLAVKVHGYLMVDEKDENAVYTNLKTSDMLVDWERRPCDKGKPIRAIVKEYIQGSSDYTGEMVPAMMKNLEELNSLGIQMWDVKHDNYMEGIPIDFSQARTVPHFMLDLNSSIWSNFFITREFYWDYRRFDRNIIGQWNKTHRYSQQIWLRFLHGYRLRSKEKRPERKAEKEAKGDWSRDISAHRRFPVAALYNWAGARKSGLRDGVIKRKTYKSQIKR